MDKDFCFRLPKNFSFNPQKDITTLELAQITLLLINKDNLAIEDLESNLKRHFKEIKSEYNT